MFDFSNAYTTVPGWVLELAMRRLHMPEELIDIMVGLVEGQRLAVRTAAGYTRCFGVEGGLPQGDPCSPILWAVVMDPLMCMLREVGERGWGSEPGGLGRSGGTVRRRRQRSGHSANWKWRCSCPTRTGS